MDINVNGTFLFTSLLSAIMKTQDLRQEHDPARGMARGSIVIMSSVSSFMAVPNMTQYTTCKHAITGIVKTAGKHIRPLNPNLNLY